MPTNTPHLSHSHLSKQWSIAAVAKIVYHRIEVSHRSFIPWKLQRFPPTRKKVIFRMICQSQTYSSVSCKQIHFHWSGQPKVFNIKVIWEKSEKNVYFLMKICLYILRFVFYKLFSTKCPINHFYRKHVWVTGMEAQTWRGHKNVICLPEFSCSPLPGTTQVRHKIEESKWK